MSCAATTTIREALRLAGMTSWTRRESDLVLQQAPFALALLEQLVEAAQADVADYLEWRSLPGNGHKGCEVMDSLAAAVAAVGPVKEPAQ